MSESWAERRRERAHQLDIVEEMEGENKLFFTFPLQIYLPSVADCTA